MRIITLSVRFITKHVKIVSDLSINRHDSENEEDI